MGVGSKLKTNYYLIKNRRFSVYLTSFSRLQNVTSDTYTTWNEIKNVIQNVVQEVCGVTRFRPKANGLVETMKKSKKK